MKVHSVGGMRPVKVEYPPASQTGKRLVIKMRLLGFSPVLHFFWRVNTFLYYYSLLLDICVLWKV